MQLKYAAIALACLAEQVYNVEAKPALDPVVAGGMRRSTDMAISHRRIFKRLADAQAPASAAAPVSSSPAATASSTVASAPPGSGNVSAACETALSSLKGVASSPTGMSVCYNVQSLDVNSGNFTSNVLLYQVAPASGNWTVIDPNSLNVDIAYAGANLKAVPTTKRDLEAHLLARAVTNTPTDAPVLITTQTFEGQVVNGWSATNETQQMMALAPSVFVTAKTPSGAPLKSVLPQTEAAFATGFFTKTAQAKAAAASAAATQTPFVLPGVTIAFFPIGLVVTSVWLGLFVIAVGAGTFGRLRFRQDYRSRAGRNNWNPVGRAGGIAAYDQR